MIMGYSCSAYFLIVIKFSLSSFINALKNDNYDELIPLLRRYSELITSRNNSDNNSKQTEITEAIYDLKDISDYESILQILNKLNDKYKNTEFYFLLNKMLDWLIRWTELDHREILPSTHLHLRCGLHLSSCDQKSRFLLPPPLSAYFTEDSGQQYATLYSLQKVINLIFNMD